MSRSTAEIDYKEIDRTSNLHMHMHLNTEYICDPLRILESFLVPRCVMQVPPACGTMYDPACIGNTYYPRAHISQLISSKAAIEDSFRQHMNAVLSSGLDIPS